MSRHVIPGSWTRRTEGTQLRSPKLAVQDRGTVVPAVCLRQLNVTEDGQVYTQNSGKLAIRPDHPCLRIKIKLCLEGALRCVKCHPNRIRGYGAVGRKWPFPITLVSGLSNHHHHHHHHHHHALVNSKTKR